ncbi:MAG TPA: phosphate acyltransferase PlsX [Bacillota bacterium]
MWIAIDAMGGDFAPREIVLGAVSACQELNAEIILVGDETAIKEVLKGKATTGLKLEIRHTSEVITMEEHPATAVRHKKNSSLVVANQLVKEGKAAAVISAGNTGAAMAASLFGLGRIAAVSRPAIAIPMPTAKGISVLLDAGANADCQPEDLLQFAHMGSVYAEKVLNLNTPRVGLLSIGEEATKGNRLTIEAHRLLNASNLNFIGNIEGRDIHRGVCEVIVCDGFVGNIVLKMTEGLAGVLFEQIKTAVTASWWSSLGGMFLRGAFRQIKAKLDNTEYGGAPLLGLNGVSIISHGNSNAKAIKNAIRVAMRAVEERLVEKITIALQTIDKIKG